MMAKAGASERHPKPAFERFIDFCNGRAEFTRQELQNAWGVSQTTANNLIRRGIGAGGIRKSRSGRFITYEVLKLCPEQKPD